MTDPIMPTEPGFWWRRTEGGCVVAAGVVRDGSGVLCWRGTLSDWWMHVGADGHWIAPATPPDEVATLRADLDAVRAHRDRLAVVAARLADWLDEEGERDGSEEAAYDAWDRALGAAAEAVGVPDDEWQRITPALRALAAGEVSDG